MTPHYITEGAKAPPDTVRSLHNRAMDIAQDALVKSISRSTESRNQSREQSTEAAQLECRALAMLLDGNEPHGKSREPSKSILSYSAAFLCLDAGYYGRAIEIALAGLVSNDLAVGDKPEVRLMEALKEVGWNIEVETWD